MQTTIGIGSMGILFIVTVCSGAVASVVTWFGIKARLERVETKIDSALNLEHRVHEVEDRLNTIMDKYCSPELCLSKRDVVREQIKRIEEKVTIEMQLLKDMLIEIKAMFNLLCKEA